MAEDTVNRLVQVGGFKDESGCLTNGYMLDGGEGWHPTHFIRLVQDHGIDVEVSVWVGQSSNIEVGTSLEPLP
jgi:glycerol-3-phosphate dehydrogenase